jgi:carboxylesterase
MSSSNGLPIMVGAEPFSHTADGAKGALVLHGFTGNPSSMRGVAEAFAAAGYHVELPRLPGHGTTVEDMQTTGWKDWTSEVEAAHGRLASRADRIVVAGLSMGGSLTLWVGAEHPEVDGLICVNPATQPQPPEVMAMLVEALEEGTDVMPGIGSDIADPDAVETAYEGTPIRPLVSFINDGLVPLADRYRSMTVPLRLFTSRQDHVVDPTQSEYLVAHYGGPVEHTWLDRSYHVATQDYDRELIFTEAIAFAERVTSGSVAAEGVAAE